MILLLALVPSAAATPIEAFPLAAPVVLPDGPVRIHVPLAMRSASDPDDGTDLLLVDANGDEIPFSRLEGTPDTWREARALVAPTALSDRYAVDASEPVDRIDVTLPAGVTVGWVEVYVGEARVAGPTRVFRMQDTSETQVRVPGLTGKFEVRIRTRRADQLEGLPPRFAFQHREGLSVPAETIPVALGEPHLQENGYARWTARLDHPLPVDRITLATAEPNLSREGGTSWIPWEDLELTGQEPFPTATGSLRRRTLGDDVTLEALTLPVPRDPTDALQVLVNVSGATVPALDGAILELDGVDLVIPDPGTGPHVLYAGAPPGTSPRWDLGAPQEVARGNEPIVSPGEVAPNPRFVAPEQRAELVAPGAPLDPAPFAAERDVTGSGLVRIPLPPEVLAHARPDLGDLRLVTADRRQLPYLVRVARSETPVPGLEATRTERGDVTRLRITLPDENLPVVFLTLASTATVFDRTLTVLDARSERPLRSVRWVADGAAGRAVVEVFGPVPQELVVTIDNGDNAPLPLDPPTATTDGRELVAVLPEDGALLWYASPGTDPPRYDWSVLEQHLGRDTSQRARAEATLGDRRSIEALQLALWDRALLAVGFGVFAVGLLLLLVDLLRKLPDPPAPPAATPPAPEPPAAG